MFSKSPMQKEYSSPHIILRYARFHIFWFDGLCSSWNQGRLFANLHSHHWAPDLSHVTEYLLIQ